VLRPSKCTSQPTPPAFARDLTAYFSELDVDCCDRLYEGGSVRTHGLSNCWVPHPTPSLIIMQPHHAIRPHDRRDGSIAGPGIPHHQGKLSLQLCVVPNPSLLPLPHTNKSTPPPPPFISLPLCTYPCLFCNPLPVRPLPRASPHQHHNPNVSFCSPPETFSSNCPLCSLGLVRFGIKGIRKHRESA
jgi:hypothetical protein